MIKNNYILDEFIKYTLAAILISVVLLPKFPFIDVPGTFVSIRVEDIILAFAALLLLIKLAIDPILFRGMRLNKPILIFLAIGFVSFLSATFLTQTIEPHIGFLHFARRIEYLIPL